VCRWWLQARPHQLLENSRQLKGPRELADVGVLRGSQAAGQAIVLTTRYVDDEFHRQCRPPSGRWRRNHRTGAMRSHQGSP